MVQTTDRSGEKSGRHSRPYFAGAVVVAGALAGRVAADARGCTHSSRLVSSRRLDSGEYPRTPAWLTPSAAVERSSPETITLKRPSRLKPSSRGALPMPEITESRR